MIVKRYRILSATATRLLELAVNEAMLLHNAVPVGSPQGNMATGYMQAVVLEEEVPDEEESPSSDN